MTTPQHSYPKSLRSVKGRTGASTVSTSLPLMPTQTPTLDLLSSSCPRFPPPSDVTGQFLGSAVRCYHWREMIKFKNSKNVFAFTFLTMHQKSPYAFINHVHVHVHYCEKVLSSLPFLFILLSRSHTYYIVKYFFTSTLSHKHIICSNFFSWTNEKCHIAQYDRDNIVIFYQRGDSQRDFNKKLGMYQRAVQCVLRKFEETEQKDGKRKSDRSCP